MDLHGICFNCFSHRGDYEVCPYCGHVAGSMPREAYNLYPGTVLSGRYVVGTVLGIGGFGVTYKAWDTKLNILVAIKEFYPAGLVNRIPGEANVMLFSGEKQQGFSQQLERFLDEARNMAKFSAEKNIVNVFDFFQENGTAYIVMEYLDGQTLKEHMAERGGRLEADEALGIMQGLLGAIENIHEKGIVHRDISPDNIFILRDGRVKLLDFGAARFTATENAQVTQSVVIKLGYAPPEQYRSNMKQGPWTDIYAAGATLYKMLTGLTPDESVDRIEKDTLKRPSQMGIMVELGIEKAIMKAMALKPELRFKSAEQMLAALENRASVDFPEEELKKRKRTRAVLIALAIAAVLGIGILAGYVGTQGGEETLADLTIEPDTIEVAVFADGAIDQGVMRELADGFTASNPDFAVSVTVYDGSEEDYAARMMGEGGPTVFLASPLTPEELSGAADLSLLIGSLNRNSYWFLNDYEKLYPSKTVLPTGMRVLTAYGNEIAADDAGVALPERVNSIGQIMQIARDSRLAMSPDRLGYVLGAFNKNLVQNGSVNLSVTALGDAYTVGNAYLSGEIAPDGALHDDTVLSVGWTYDLRAAQAAWPGYYRVIPLVDGSSPYVLLSEGWCVNPSATDNKQKAGMLFLHFMLSEYAQNVLFLQRDGDMPINRAAMEQYLSINPDFDYLSGSLGRGNVQGEDGYAVRRINRQVSDVLTEGGDLGAVLELLQGE